MYKLHDKLNSRLNIHIKTVSEIKDCWVIADKILTQGVNNYIGILNSGSQKL